MQTNDHAGLIANLPKQRRIAGLRFPVRQVRVEQEIGVRWHEKAAIREIGGGGGACEWHGAREDVGDLERRIALRGRGRLRCSPFRRARRHAGDLGGLDDQRAAVESCGLLNGADRPTAVIAVEVDPVAGMRPAQRDDAGARVARCGAPDVREAPLVARAPAVRKQPRHPRLSGLAQSLDDQVQVVAVRIAAEWLGVVEVDHCGCHWNASAGTTPLNQLRSLRTAMNANPGPG